MKWKTRSGLGGGAPVTNLSVYERFKACCLRRMYVYMSVQIGRNIEKELSFDFGPSAEFAYLYSQCYELSTSE